MPLKKVYNLELPASADLLLHVHLRDGPIMKTVLYIW